MNSKQALLEIYLEAQSNQFHFTTEELVERINKINNELEVLEILKGIVSKASFDVEDDEGNDCVVIEIRHTKTHADYKKIKEWLNNE